MLRAVETAVQSATAAWRRARAIDLALRLAPWALGGATLTALGIEIFGGGLLVAQLPPLCLWLTLPVLGLLVGGWRAPAPAAAAKELDARADLHDRLGTALAFRASEGAMASLQRADALRHAEGLDAAACFTLPWARRVRPLLATLLLLLALLGASLSFQLGPSPGSEPQVQRSSTDDLLAVIEEQQEQMLELGNKQAHRLLSDLEQQIRRIKAREDKIQLLSKGRRPESRREDDDLPEPALAPPPEPRKPDDGELITAEDLQRLEEQTIDQLVLTDAHQSAMISKLIGGARTAKKLTRDFHELMERQDASRSSNNNSMKVRARSTGSDAVQNKINNSDMLNDPGLSDKLNKVEDYASSREDMIRGELDAESQAAHDQGHNLSESFNQFLKDFVKDVQEAVHSAATGKKRGIDEDRTVQTRGPQGMADKRDAMQESGFEEMGEQKRSSEGGDGPAEMMGDLDKGTPPTDMENMQVGEGSPGEDSMAIQGGETGETSAGASGAGTGSADQEGGLQALARLSSTEGGPLESVLGAISAGRIPPEEREQLFDRISRYKIQGGKASEADDVVIDYFAEAEDLMISNRGALPPLFRDYAHNYFNSIRPGGDSPSE